MSATAAELTTVRERWQAAWDDALGHWSRFTKLTEPRWCLTVADEQRERLSGSFAMIRLNDHAVVISLKQIVEQGLEGFPREVLAHEIGHHVYAPGDLRDNARLLARIRRGLPSREAYAGLISNLYSDLLINDRLQRSAGLDMAGVFQKLETSGGDKLWRLYMRIYEVLWSLPRDTLTGGGTDAQLDIDAYFGARVVRAFRKDWLDGAGRFAVLCLPYLEEKQGNPFASPWLDALNAGAGGAVPDGLARVDDGELEGIVHPMLDGEMAGLDASGSDAPGLDDDLQLEPDLEGGRKNKYRDPSRYVELLRSVGVELSEKELVIRYYRELAAPFLPEFPTRIVAQSSDPLPEGLETWDLGSPIDRVDWLESVIRSPVVIPGMTTVSRTFGTTAGSQPEREPLDLYLGIDCSGSMTNPARGVSYPVIAGTAIVLAALRVGARVKATLSGASGGSGKHSSTGEFVRDQREVLKVLTGYLGTGYAFGIGRLKKTFLDGDPPARTTHILILTDSDIFMMLKEVKGGWRIAREALEVAKGGGSLVLDMDPGWGYQAEIERLRSMGWDVYHVHGDEDLLRFARDFSRAKFGEARDR